MKLNQEITPKYWVIHSKVDSDIILETMAKTLTEAVVKMDLIDPDWQHVEMLQGGFKYAPIHIEIQEVL